jgi:hypothetical protein
VLRIRNDATVKELHIPKDKLVVLDKIISSNVADKTEQQIIRKLTGTSPCSVCSSYATLEVSYPVLEGGATRIEHYCNRCIEKVYARKQVL